MEFVPRELIGLVGWLVAAGIVFQARRRFPGRGSTLALIGFLLPLGSAVGRLAAMPILLAQDISSVTFGIALSLLGLPGLVGIILIVYAFWVILRHSPPVQPSEKGDP